MYPHRVLYRNRDPKPMVWGPLFRVSKGVPGETPLGTPPDPYLDPYLGP